MAIVTEEDLYGGSARADRGNTTYVRQFRAIADSSLDRPKSIVAAVRTQFGIAIGDHYKVLSPLDGITVLEEDTNAFLAEFNAVLDGQADDGCQWTVTVTYSSADGEGQFPPNPIDHPTKVNYTSSRQDKVPTEDRDGNAIVNSAGESFSHVPAIDEYRNVIQIQRNVAVWDPDLANDYKGTVNIGPFTVGPKTYPAGTVKCNDIKADWDFHVECGWYWVVDFEFEVNLGGWDTHLLDEGMRYRDATSHKLKAINDENGQPVGDPTPLDGTGLQLGTGVDPVFLDFHVLPEMDFDDFGFDYTDTPGF
jgi:hypothetical protein